MKEKGRELSRSNETTGPKVQIMDGVCVVCVMRCMWYVCTEWYVWDVC